MYTDNFILGGEGLERVLLLLIDVSLPDVPLKCSCLPTSTHLLSFSVRRRVGKRKLFKNRKQGRRGNQCLCRHPSVLLTLQPDEQLVVPEQDLSCRRLGGCLSQ